MPASQGQQLSLSAQVILVSSKRLVPASVILAALLALPVYALTPAAGRNGMVTSNTPGYSAGGTLDVAGEAINLLAGNNIITFTYASSEWPGPQGVGDEGWGVNSARIETAASASAVPEPPSIALLASGILVFFVSRRKAGA